MAMMPILILFRMVYDYERQVVIVSTDYRSVLEEPVRSSSSPINQDWNESWNAGTETNPRSVKMPAMTRQDRFQNTIEWEPIVTKSTTNE